MPEILSAGGKTNCTTFSLLSRPLLAFTACISSSVCSVVSTSTRCLISSRVKTIFVSSSDVYLRTMSSSFSALFPLASCRFISDTPLSFRKCTILCISKLDAPVITHTFSIIFLSFFESLCFVCLQYAGFFSSRCIFADFFAGQASCLHAAAGKKRYLVYFVAIFFQHFIYTQQT